MQSSAWHTLPIEMKIAVVDLLSVDDVKVFSMVDQEAYALSVPTMFKHVKLSSYEALKGFLTHVPRSYFHHIQRLDLSTMISKPTTAAYTDTPHPRTDAVVSLLSSCSRLEYLSLELSGGLARHAIPCFSHLPVLKELSISNWGPEESMPISERLVVSVAASLPSLEKLSLHCISRSTLHAPELIGVYPYIPLVTGDDDIEDHPILGADLSLPSLLRIPTLRELKIQDTHLGDPRWAVTPTACRLQVLELGSCQHETEETNSAFIESIMSNIGPTVDEASLSTVIASETFAEPSATPLKHLRKLNISPFFPVDSVVDTMTNLSGSPIESVSVRCFEDDVVDVCSAVEDFLSLRVERGFYRNLTKIDVSVTPSDLSSAKSEDAKERADAAKRLQEFCNDLYLGGVVCDMPAAGVRCGESTKLHNQNASDNKKCPEPGTCRS